MRLPAGKKILIGLREHKKAKTRSEIQKQAWRLFRKKGYDSTTIEQIAEAAEVSPSTFYRYFSTKENVVLYDIFDPVFINTFKAQPAELRPIQALQAAIRSVSNNLSAKQVEQFREREALVRKVPALRASLLEEIIRNIELLTKLVSERTGRSASDLSVRAMVGAVMGIVITVPFTSTENENGSWFENTDVALDQLEAGLLL